jgi:hemerythrin
MKPLKRIIFGSEQELLEWKRSYSVGVSLFDNQNREFIKLINELYEANRTEWKNTQDAFIRLIRFTARYADTELRNEEKLMALVGYPEYKQHKKEHNDFLKEVYKQTSAFIEGREIDILGFVLFMRDWILSHVGICDKRMGFFLMHLKNEGVLSGIIMEVKTHVEDGIVIIG